MHIYLCLTWCAFEHQVRILHSHCVVGQEIELCQKMRKNRQNWAGPAWVCGPLDWPFAQFCSHSIPRHMVICIWASMASKQSSYNFINS
jgi:hypothetical protein